MKTCVGCKQVKSLEQFGNWKRSKDGKYPRCKVCKREYDNQYYKNNENRADYLKAAAKVYVGKNRQWVWDYLLQHPCIDCGESDPIVLEFDHVRGDKINNVSRMIRINGLDAIQAEIAKCEVRCANCHRRVTYKRAGWFVGVMPS
jgi:hypothetical protein